MKENLPNITILLCLSIIVQGAFLSVAEERDPEEKVWKEVNGMEPSSLKNFLEAFPDGKYADKAQLYLSLHTEIDAIKSKRKKPSFVIPFAELGKRWEEWKKRRPEKDAIGISCRKTDFGTTFGIFSTLGSGTISFDAYGTPITPTGDGSIVAFETGGLSLRYVGLLTIQCTSEEIMYFGVIHAVGFVHLHGKGKVIMSDGKEVELPVPEKAKIAFTSLRNGNYEVYVMNPDGSEQTNLTRHPAMDGSPSWSPGGEKIAFASTRDGNLEIYVMNADGSGQKRLTNDPASDNLPQWSHDGKKIAFTSERDGNSEIYIMDADGGQLQRLTNIAAFDAISSWSPDGKRIAFNSDRDGNLEIYVMDVDGGGQRRLTKNPDNDGDPSWAPNGGRIAFTSERDGNPEIYVMNEDGSDQIRLTRNTAIDGYPSWSPDGKKIAFMSYRNRNDEIYIMNADGTEQVNLTKNPSVDSYACWSPFLKAVE